jgi:hypothetical protein
VADPPLEGAVVGIELQQVGVGLGVREIVEGDHLNVTVQAVLLVDGAIREATDAAEAVDADANGHGESPGGGTSWGPAAPATLRMGGHWRRRNIHRFAAGAQSLRESRGF